MDTPAGPLADKAVAALHVATAAVSAAKLAAGARGVVAPFDDEHRVHAGLVATVLRLVVLAFAEPRGLLGRHRIREALAGGPGAWSRLGALFRAIHASHAGGLFDVERYPCFDGEPLGARVHDDAVPLLYDVVRATAADWRTVDVEHLGGVYEALIGLRVVVAREPTLLVRARRKPGLGPIDVCVGLTTLLTAEGARRAAVLEAWGVELPAAAGAALACASSEDELSAALRRRVSPLCPAVVPAGGLVIEPTEQRRRSGSHYTSRALTEPVVAATLAPRLAALGASASIDAVLGLSVCDPAMGSGAFLVEACRQLGAALARARDADPSWARAAVAARCLYGVDRDAMAVDVARASLWLAVACGDCDGGESSSDRDARVARAAEPAMSFVDHALRVGDALVGATRAEWSDDAGDGTPATPVDPERARRLADAAVDAFFSGRSPIERRAALFGHRAALASGGAPPQMPHAQRIAPFHWQLELPTVFDTAEPGFDAVVGNPPWVSYVGRAAQPLDDGLRAWFGERYAAFAGYRNLQGIFAERASALLKPGGRLGLVVPSSMSELDGYAPTRRAHDALCECDAVLPDLGEDAFGGVFQPCLVLHSTRRAAPHAGSDAPWPVERNDLDETDRALVARMAAGPPLPPELFGERGLQTRGEDLEHVRREPDARHSVALRVGADVAPFRRRAPTLFADAAWFRDRLRAPEVWQKVRFYVRQTARVPLACLADGQAFRNSVLAGFESSAYSAPFLVAWLSATPIRWLHWVRHRDARQGMPQMKIGHLRRTPAPPDAECVPLLARIGRDLSDRNDGLHEAVQAELDAIVARAFGLTRTDVSRIDAWARALPP